MLTAVQVYQIVCKLVDEQQSEGADLRLTVPTIYDRIKRSNSSLNRRSKKLLEDSIERVLDVVKADALYDEESESVEGDFEGLEDKQEEKQQLPVWDWNNNTKSIEMADICLGSEWHEQEHCWNVEHTVETSAVTKEIG